MWSVLNQLYKPQSSNDFLKSLYNLPVKRLIEKMIAKVLLTFALAVLTANGQSVPSSPGQSLVCIGLLCMHVYMLLIISLQPIRPRRNCADPNLTARYVTFFDAGRTTHTVDQRWLFVNNDVPASAAEWAFQGDNFCAWASPQNFTSPLYLFFNPSTTDYQFILSADGSIPAPSGLQSQGIRAYVYPTQQPRCGSVPLYELSKPSVGDHWYTIVQRERASMLAAGTGWVDNGIIAHVLPLKSTFHASL